MDFVTRQFIVLAKKLRKDFRDALDGIRGDVQQQINAIRETRDAYRESQKSPPVFSAQLQVPHPIAVQEYPADNRKRARDVMHLVTAVLTLLFVIAYAAISYNQWREMAHQSDMSGIAMKKARREAANQLKVAQDSLNETRLAFETDRRAWIGAIFIWHPFPVLKNYGKSPAFDVRNTAVYYCNPGGPINDVAYWWAHDKLIPDKNSFSRMGIIWPDETGGMFDVRAPPSPNADPDIRNGICQLYVVGETTYTTFGKGRTTKYCGLWLPKANAFDPGGGCKTWNYAD